MDKQSALVIINLIANLVLASQIFLVIMLIVLFLKKIVKKSKLLNKTVHFFADNGLIFAFFVALVASVSSLFLSEIAHFIPCKLCWYQRIIMYPLVLILGIAMVKNDFAVKRYVLPLAVIGLVIAIYHYALQMSPIPLPCSDEVANCALKQINYFGFMTIPAMAATAFALIIFFMVILKGKKSTS